jgi:hypothetical protein
MLGQFSEESLSSYASLVEEKVGPSFSKFEEDEYDFTRCMRPNGTYYGTRGKCRKGVESGAEKSGREQKERVPKVARNERKGTYSNLSKKAQEAMGRGEIDLALKLNARAMKLLKDSENKKSEGPAKDEKRSKISNLKESLKNVKTGKVSSDDDSVTISARFGKNTIKTIVTPKTDGSFEIGYKVNDSYAKGGISVAKEKLKAILIAKRQFEEVLKTLSEGTKVRAFAYDDDGSGDIRKKAYEKLGFKHQGNNVLTGVLKSGKIEGADFSEGIEGVSIWMDVFFPEP